MSTEILPFAELTADKIGNRDIARKNSTLGEQVIKIELSKILMRDGFNVRVDYGDLDGLAYSILENGQTVPGRVDVLADGTFLLTDGHRRYRALCLLADMGHEPMFKAIVNSTKITEEERILQMFTTQDNKPLAPHEIAELIKRLINLGHNQSGIAKKIGKTPAYVSQMLSYASESIIIKEHVTNGDINVSAVLKLQKKIPVQSERVAAVNKAVSEKKNGNTVKTVTVEKVTGKSAKDEKAETMAKAIMKRFCIEKDELNDLTAFIKTML